MARTLVKVLLIAMIASACGGSTEGSSGEVLAGQQLDAQPSAALERSPMEQEAGFGSEPSSRNEHFITMQRRANESVVACMRSAGFDYFPEPVDRRRLLGPRAGTGTAEWAGVNGLGITTSLLELTKGDQGDGSLSASEANARYTAQLSFDDATRYDAALIGTGASGASGDGAAVNDAGSALGPFTPTGCWGDAYGELVKQLQLADRLDSELEVLNDRVQSDPRMRTLMAEWSDCMADRGHRYDDRDALLDDYYARSLTIEVIETENGAELADPAAVDRQLAAEIAVALDDVACREPGAADAAELRDIYEREFLADNASVIAATLQPDA